MTSSGPDPQQTSKILTILTSKHNKNNHTVAITDYEKDIPDTKID